MFLTMRKTFFYNFIPTNAEEEACKATNTPYKPTRVMAEVRDVYPPPPPPGSDPLNPWRIKKVLTPVEVNSGSIVLSHNDTLDHVFRYWSLETAGRVALGHRQSVVVWDVTDEGNPKSYGVNAEEEVMVFLQQGSVECDYFVLACMELVRDRRLSGGDEVGLYWDVKTASFQFKLLS